MRERRRVSRPVRLLKRLFVLLVETLFLVVCSALVGFLCLLMYSQDYPMVSGAFSLLLALILLGVGKELFDDYIWWVKDAHRHWKYRQHKKSIEKRYFSNLSKKEKS